MVARGHLLLAGRRGGALAPLIAEATRRGDPSRRGRLAPAGPGRRLAAGVTGRRDGSRMRTACGGPGGSPARTDGPAGRGALAACQATGVLSGGGRRSSRTLSVWSDRRERPQPLDWKSDVDRIKALHPSPLLLHTDRRRPEFCEGYIKQDVARGPLF